MADAEIRRLERAAACGDQNALSALVRARRRSGQTPMLLLTEFMRNADKPRLKDFDADDPEFGWSAGGSSHLEALRFYLCEEIEILLSERQNDYQGSVYALLRTQGDSPVFVIWRDSFGSCSGCDGLEGENGYDYIKATLAEGNTRQFWSLEEVIQYLKTTEDYYWCCRADEDGDLLSNVYPRLQFLGKIQALFAQQSTQMRGF